MWLNKIKFGNPAARPYETRFKASGFASYFLNRLPLSSNVLYKIKEIGYQEKKLKLQGLGVRKDL